MRATPSAGPLVLVSPVLTATRDGVTAQAEGTWTSGAQLTAPVTLPSGVHGDSELAIPWWGVWRVCSPSWALAIPTGCSVPSLSAWVTAIHRPAVHLRPSTPESPRAAPAGSSCAPRDCLTRVGAGLQREGGRIPACESQGEKGPRTGSDGATPVPNHSAAQQEKLRNEQICLFAESPAGTHHGDTGL